MVFFSRGRLAYGLCLAVASLAMAAASGCGPSKASVTGTVTYSGQPLPSGTITFASEAGAKPVKASPITDGKYTITDFIAGPAKVTVLTTPPPSGGGKPPPGAPAIAVPTTAAPGKYVPIPAKYNNPQQSGLSYDVKGGEQTKNFDLTP
jgi:hypothetical protein